MTVQCKLKSIPDYPVLPENLHHQIVPIDCPNSASHAVERAASNVESAHIVNKIGPLAAKPSQRNGVLSSIELDSSPDFDPTSIQLDEIYIARMYNYDLVERHDYSVTLQPIEAGIPPHDQGQSGPGFRCNVYWPNTGETEVAYWFANEFVRLADANEKKIFLMKTRIK